MPRAADLQLLGRELRQLAEHSTLTKSDLDIWYERAHKIRNHIVENAELANVVPHQVWHFLSDADIRFREPDYARQQHEAFLEIVKILERGQVP